MSDVPNISAVYPLAWLDPAMRCSVCGDLARYSDVWGDELYCSQVCRDRHWEGS